MADIIQLA